MNLGRIRHLRTSLRSDTESEPTKVTCARMVAVVDTIQQREWGTLSYVVIGNHRQASREPQISATDADFALGFNRDFYKIEPLPTTYYRAMYQSLDDQLPKWIRRAGPIPWPSRSPDLTQVDLFHEVKILSSKEEEARQFLGPPAFSVQAWFSDDFYSKSGALKLSVFLKVH
jgi:hypothetical protein